MVGVGAYCRIIGQRTCFLHLFSAHRCTGLSCLIMPDKPETPVFSVYIYSRMCPFTSAIIEIGRAKRMRTCAVGLCLNCQVYGIFLMAIYLYNSLRISGCTHTHAILIGFNSSLLPFLRDCCVRFLLILHGLFVMIRTVVCTAFDILEKETLYCVSFIDNSLCWRFSWCLTKLL